MNQTGMNQTGMNRDDPGSTPKQPLRSIQAWLGIAVVLVAAAGVFYVLINDGQQGRQSGDNPEQFQLDLKRLVEVPDELLTFVQDAAFELQISDPATIAVASTGSVFVGGGQDIEVLGADGKHASLLHLGRKTTSLTVGCEESPRPNHLFVAVGNQILVYDSALKTLPTWEIGEEKSLFTAMASTPNELFVADAGNRVVLRLDYSGKVIGRIGNDSPDEDLPGFVIPSPYFDLAISHDQILHVANTGMRRVESYSSDGELQSFWGEAGSSLSEFFGCCNPAHLAILPDGRFVTSEKGIPRIKIYSETGTFESVAAGPRELGLRESDLADARGEEFRPVFDIAVDQLGRILALDPRNRCIRRFSPTKPLTES